MSCCLVGQLPVVSHRLACIVPSSAVPREAQRHVDHGACTESIEVYCIKLIMIQYDIYQGGMNPRIFWTVILDLLYHDILVYRI